MALTAADPNAAPSSLLASGYRPDNGSAIARALENMLLQTGLAPPPNRVEARNARA